MREPRSQCWRIFGEEYDHANPATIVHKPVAPARYMFWSALIVAAAPLEGASAAHNRAKTRKTATLGAKASIVARTKGRRTR